MIWQFGAISFGNLAQFRLAIWNVLQLDGFNQRPLAKENLVRNGHDLPLHVVLQLRNQLNPVHKKSREEILADISLVPDQLAENLFDERLVAERLPVVDVAGRDHEVQQVPLLVADQVQLEPVEPSHRTLSALGKPLEDPVEMDALVPAYPQRGAVNEADARADSHAALLDEQDERDGDLPFQFDEPVVGYCFWEQVPHMLADFVHVKVFQTFVSAQVEQYHDGDYLGIGQRSLPVMLPLPIGPTGDETVDLDESVINLAEVIRHTENFRNFVLDTRHSESVCFLSLFLFFNLQKLSLFS